MGRATLHHTQEQMRDEMQKLNARIQGLAAAVVAAADGRRWWTRRCGRRRGISSANASVSAPAANFPAALKLAVEMLREPAYADAEFDRMGSSA